MFVRLFYPATEYRIYVICIVIVGVPTGSNLFDFLSHYQNRRIINNNKNTIHPLLLSASIYVLRTRRTASIFHNTPYLWRNMDTKPLINKYLHKHRKPTKVRELATSYSDQINRVNRSINLKNMTCLRWKKS